MVGSKPPHRARPSTRYRYQLADGTLVPDPASRFQPEDVHGPSAVSRSQLLCLAQHRVARPALARDRALRTARRLLGGFAGVARELPRLRDLGITAVEFMPVNDFPGRRNWGYDGVLPYAPDSAYGTPDELKALVDAAHDHGLMIFLDVVYNHFGPDGNYLHAYAPQFFREDHKTPWGPAIDFRRPEVRAFFTENVLMWLMEYRFDGLRFDAVHAIEDQSWVDEMAATVRAAIEPGRHVHLVLEHHNDASHLANGRRRAVERRRPQRAARAADRRGRRLLRRLRRPPGRQAGARPGRGLGLPGRAFRLSRRQPRQSQHATCRPPRTCCSCRTTTRSATARSASA